MADNIRYLIGIDSGGTKTRALLTDASGFVLGECLGEGTNHHTLPVPIVKATLNKLLQELRASSGLLSLNQLSCICFAGAGIDTDEDIALVRSFFEDWGYEGSLIVCSDGEAVLAGSGDQAIIACGTGSIAYGYDREGSVFRVGGWGYLIDDVCSGYSIATEGLRAVVEACDGRGPQTKIKEEIFTALKISTCEDLIPFLYGEDASPGGTAALAPCVVRLAGKDTVADAILDHETNQLLRMLDALCLKIGGTAFGLGLFGGIFSTNAVRESFIHKAIQKYPELKIHPIEGNTAAGAVRLALNTNLSGK